MAELEGVARALLADPGDRAAWQELAKWAARGHPPPPSLCTPDVAQAACDELWRGADVEGLPELVAALRAAVPGADLVEIDAPYPTWTQASRSPEPVRAGPVGEPTAWPDHDGAEALVVGEAPGWVVSRSVSGSRLWRWATRELVAEGRGPAAFSPDGRWVALADERGVELLELLPAGPLSGWRLGGLGASVVAVRFDAAGDLFVLAMGGLGLEVSPETREVRGFPVRWPEALSWAWSWTLGGLVYQTGHTVVFADSRGRAVGVVGYAEDPATRAALDRGGRAVAVSRARGVEVYSPGGRLLTQLTWRARAVGLDAGPPLRVAMAEPGHVYLHEPAAPERTQPLLVLPGRPAPAVAMVPGGDVLVLTGQGMLRAWRPATGAWLPAEDLRGFAGGVAALALDRDGLHLGVRDGEGGVWRRDLFGDTRLIGATAAGLRELGVDLDAPTSPGLAAHLEVEGITAHAAHDGRREVAVGLADGAVELRRLDTGSGPPGRRIEAHEGPVTTLVYGLDGRYLFSGGEDGRVVVHRLGLAPIPPPPRPRG